MGESIAMRIQAKKIFGWILSVWLPLEGFSQSFLLHRQAFRLERWTFYQGDIPSAESPSLSPLEGWTQVTVPHTWNAKDVLTLGDRSYQGIGWYRTRFSLPKENWGKRTFVRFEGVCLIADVFLNGIYLGTHRGGYSAFCFEVTPYVIYDGENVLCVKVDNSMHPDVAPSGAYLYPLFGGIYRPVTVFSTSDLCISPLDDASSGVTVRPLWVSKEKAEIAIESLLDYQYEPQLETSLSKFHPSKGRKGQGLRGEYFSNSEFKGKPKHVRVDKAIAFDYGRKGPFADMEGDSFSVRWTGEFIPQKGGKYRFVLKSDDGSRLYLNGRLVIEHWGMHAVSERDCEVELEAQKPVSIRIEYNEIGGDAVVIFGWKFLDESLQKANAVLQTAIVDQEGKVVAEKENPLQLKNRTDSLCVQRFTLASPHLWDGKKDPYLYRVKVQIKDSQGRLLDQVEEPFGLRFYWVDKDSGLILNGRSYPLYGVSRHQEWEGLGSALSDAHHEADVEAILELGATGVRLAHYPQAEKMYALCDEKGLVVWAEIPNTPAYRATPQYLENCKRQLTELIKQNINHPSIFFWGLYNEVDIPPEDLKVLQETAKTLDPSRLTTQADNTQVSARHFVTDVAAWNWYYGWYYGDFGQYRAWFDALHEKYPSLLAGLSEYGAGGCISQQQENPQRPDAHQGRFFPEQYQRLYHEKVWAEIKDRKDIWCKFIWNLADFSWTTVRRGDRDFINHKGLMAHTHQIRKDAFYFYKANWSTEPVLYITSRRNVIRKEKEVRVEVYTNLDRVALYVNGEFVSEKPMTSEIHKITWENVPLAPGRNKISVIGHQNGKVYTDACEWILVE